MKTIGEVITFVEMINKCNKEERLRIHEVASDRWSLSAKLLVTEKWATLVTGRDPLDCWNRWENNQRLS